MRINEILLAEARFTPAELEQMKQMHLDSVSLADISRKLGRDQTTIFKKINQLFPNRSKVIRKPFTPTELEQIKQMHLDGVSTAGIAKSLDRNVSNINAKLDQFFPNRDKEVHALFTFDELEKLKELYHKGLSRSEIANTLNRSAVTVSNKLDQLFPNRDKRPLRRFTPGEIEKIKKLSATGMSPAEISRKLDREESSVLMKINQLFPDRAKLDRILFTPDEVEKIKDLHASGIPAAQIAKQLNRSAGSVVGKINLLFPDRNKSDRVPFTDNEIEKIKELYNSGMSNIEISRKLNRAPGSINAKINQLFPDRGKTIQNPFTPKDISAMSNLFQKGYSARYIADQLTKISGIERGYSSVYRKLSSLPDFRDKLVPAHLENLQRLPANISQAEIKFFNILSQINGIPKIERNVKLKREKYHYNIDGIGPNKVAIEFFGSLWHADPNMFPDSDQYIPKLSCTAGEVREKDRRKIEWLEEQEYKVVVVWENEWTKKATRQACIDRVLAAFNKK